MAFLARLGLSASISLEPVYRYNPAMPTQSPLRWEPFIVKLEAASERGDADFVAANMTRLEQAIAELMHYQHKLAELQYRARLVRDRHEPPV